VLITIPVLTYLILVALGTGGAFSEIYILIDRDIGYGVYIRRTGRGKKAENKIRKNVIRYAFFIFPPLPIYYYKS
jgi:hypothetical protein